MTNGKAKRTRIGIRDALTSGLIDYAGLFPPAGEDMRTAVDNYSDYLRGPDRGALGRFIVPFARLKEFEDAGADQFPRGQKGARWRISVLVSDDVRHAVEEIEKFNTRHSARSRRGAAAIDVVELKAGTVEEIANQHRDLPKNLISYFEIPLTPDLAALIKAIREVSSRAKIRTGGLTPEAIPRSQAIVDFIDACRSESVPFKATAGLHHAIRGEYNLTYEPGGPIGKMHGFLNVFVAAALLATGENDDVGLGALEETNPSAFEFHDDYLVWNGKRITAEQLASVRSNNAISFGSCSFREPIDELAGLLKRKQPTRT
ncbi:MAG TPA: hypothetical protein VJ840_11890 [Gemmatimonadaceae bacterium]|nr:hypothetical protein [Gemmatimonadaceae bacterium]